MEFYVIEITGLIFTIFLLKHLLLKHRQIILLWNNKYFIYLMIKNYLSTIFDNKKPSIIIHDTHVHINYYVDGALHSIKVPRENKIKHHKMYLIKDGDEIDITHKHGIKYLCTARELKGDYIIKKIMDEEVNRYDVDEVPN